MGYYTEISNSQYAAKDTALYNRLNGVNGHTFLGTFLVSNTTNIFGMAAQAIGNNWSEKGDVTGPETETDTVDTDASSKNISNFTAAMKAFGKNPTKETAQALKKAYEADPENPTIKRYWKNYESKVNEKLKEA